MDIGPWNLLCQLLSCLRLYAAVTGDDLAKIVSRPFDVWRMALTSQAIRTLPLAAAILLAGGSRLRPTA